MSDHFHEVQLSLAEFDRNQLPESQRELQGEAFRNAVEEHLTAEFVDGMGAAELVITGDRIIIRWMDSAEIGSVTERGIDFLKEGDYGKGIATLRLALRRDPTDAEALFNLAMALSDQGELDESVELLGRLLTDQPAHTHGWVALGVAEARRNNDHAAINALRMAVALNPDDGYSQKNLGAILARSGVREESIRHLRLATRLLPADPSAWLNLGMVLEEADELDEADEAFLKVLALDPTGQLGHRAEKGRSQIAEKTFRARGGDLRPDAFSYCLGALQRFDGMPKSEIQKISFEIAMLGTRGLDVNDPAPKYTLTSIPGKFSGLHLLCIEYVGFQIIDPSIDLGFDLSAEYAAARKRHGAG
jgi:tetratricopeptide (TPR) repeat protein